MLASFKILCILLLISSLAHGKADKPAEIDGDYVVVLHGMGRTYRSMKKMCRYLEKQNYKTVNVDYPSRKKSINFLAFTYLDSVIKNECPDTAKKINFVSHSLGGIIVRVYLAGRPLPNLGRAVMLAPPNQGSEITDWLKENFMYRRGLGPSGQALGTDSASMPSRLGPVGFELGVIAGDRTTNPLFSSKLPGPDDGKVTVENTKVEGMKDHIVVHKSHSFIMNSREVIDQVIYFLDHGTFKKDPMPEQ
jgi:pimeloyl-ACP methyl ester carboxylesterase